MLSSYLGLGGRIVLLGVERIVVKRLGDDADPFSGAFLFFFLGALFLLPFVFWENPQFLCSPIPYLSGALFSGIFYSVAFVCYVRALSGGEVSLVSPLYNFNVFFLALLATVFLGESFTIWKGCGLALLVYGSSFLSRPEGGGGPLASLKALVSNRNCQFMIASSFLIAVGRVVDKYLIASAPPVAYSFVLYMVIAFYIWAFMLLRGNPAGGVQLLRARPVPALVSGAINGYSYLFLLYALKGLEVSVAEPASMLGLIITLLLSRMILQENIGRRWIAVAVMIAGSWLLFI